MAGEAREHALISDTHGIVQAGQLSVRASQGFSSNIVSARLQKKDISLSFGLLFHSQEMEEEISMSEHR